MAGLQGIVAALDEETHGGRISTRIVWIERIIENGIASRIDSKRHRQPVGGYR